jgi:hypothetical protein
MSRLVALSTFVFTCWVTSPTLAQDRVDRMGTRPDPVVAKINQFIQQGWTDNEVQASAVAADEEWLRRVYLDIVGEIPPLEAAESFLKSEDETKRQKLVASLLNDPAYVRHFSTIWTNNCIGRGEPRRISRGGMSKFFREVFARNRPWNEVVVDLVTAEGHFEKNGAANYILAQMQNRDEGVQLTAKTARLFMGIQVQCTQCHNHPFNDWKQDQFWQLNAFFRQTGKRDHRKFDPNTGRQVDDYSEVTYLPDGRGREDKFEGKVFFEKRSGLMVTAYPKYFDKEVEIPKFMDEINLRTEFGKFLSEPEIEGGSPLIAKAMVNRMWGRMFGYGFTRPIDDMGPHNPASHPELFDYLSAEFVKANYDVKKLIGWIANTEAYSLTSKFSETNKIDDPAAGETPLFSHMYVKSMEAEQLYNSLIVATNAHKSGKMNYEEAERRRNRWMQQFVTAFGTDENDESTTFNGTIPQALMMMNGELVEDAVNLKEGSFLRGLLAGRGRPAEKVNKLYLAALTRKPTRMEVNRVSKLVKNYPRGAEAAAWQDLFWALLNSNEFIFVH